MNIITIIPLFLGNMRGWQPIIILIIILLLFGGKKIPEMMRGLGKGIKAFKEGVKDAQNELDKSLKDEPEDKSGKKD